MAVVQPRFSQAGGLTKTSTKRRSLPPAERQIQRRQGSSIRPSIPTKAITSTVRGISLSTSTESADGKSTTLLWLAAMN
jgi:hypothetical protein